IIRSLHELIDMLETMDEDTFHFHVNESKNDFANWIRGVLGDEDLAQRISDARTRDAVISVIESVPVRMAKDSLIDAPKPSEYLVLGGVLVRDLYELLDALREMSDQTFAKYVDDRHNMIASRLIKLDKNGLVANKLAECTSRTDMISLLEQNI
ncbi:MAG: DUF5752 family protein, partial [archaeon]